MNDLMVQVLVVAILANVVLVVVAVIRSYLIRTRRERMTASPPATAASESTVAATDGLVPPSVRAPEAEVLANAAAEADVETPADAPAVIAPFERAPGPGPQPATEITEEAAMTAQSEEPMPREDAAVTGLFDEDTGLRGPLAWKEAISHEESRRARYGQQVTIVVVELDRLDALARQLGHENADRLIRPVAQALKGNARAADIVARLGHHRFGILLPETDEIRAINYVERVRQACDSWLDAAAVSVRLAIGWASVHSGGDLGAAFGTAERRMYAERSGSRVTAEGGAAAVEAEPPAEAPESAEPEPPAEGSVPYSGWNEPAAEPGL